MDLIGLYSRIVRQANIRKLPEGNVYLEWHHILPLCMGGSNTVENVVLLTIKEHYIIHHLLARINPEDYVLQQTKRIMAVRYHKSQLHREWISRERLKTVKQKPPPSRRRCYGIVIGQMSIESRQLAAKIFVSLSQLSV